MQQIEYQFDHHKLTLIDPELGISHSEVFEPNLVPQNPDIGYQFPDGSLLRIRQTTKQHPIEYSVEKQNLLNGQYQIHYPSEKLKYECYYKEGLLHGPSICYSEDGKVIATTWYLNGKKEGLSEWFYLSGERYSTQRFKSGLWQGKQEYFYKDGTYKTVLCYEKGELVQAVVYDGDGIARG